MNSKRFSVLKDDIRVEECCLLPYSRALQELLGGAYLTLMLMYVVSARKVHLSAAGLAASGRIGFRNSLSLCIAHAMNRPSSVHFSESESAVISV